MSLPSTSPNSSPKTPRPRTSSSTDQMPVSLQSPLKGRLRLSRMVRKHHEQQQYQPLGDNEEGDVTSSYQQKTGRSAEEESTAMEFTVDDQDMTGSDLDMAQEPAILRLSPELLALIFHYVYVTPVVHRLSTALAKDTVSSEDSSSSQGSSTASPPSSSSSASSSSSSSPSPSSTSCPSPSEWEESPASISTRATAITITSESSASSSTSSSAATSASSGSGARRRKDKRKPAVYIQNDLSSMLALCLTCRVFYPQAMRMLWRQRTLASFDDLSEFYQAIDFSASLRKRQQKQRQLQQQQRLGMGYAVEEGLFNNEAALRIKSLTLLDMSLGSSLPSSLVAASVTDATSALASSQQFFGSSDNNHSANDHLPLKGGASQDLCQGIDSFARGYTTEDIHGSNSTAQLSFAKDNAPTSSPSSSSSSAVSRRRSRQKTTSVYSDLISPRLLMTIANHCYALVDLTICMDNKKPLSVLDSPRPKAYQPTLPLSIIAGALLSLKRLSLMGLVCDPKHNKTGSELMVFAQNVQPLERLSIRACKGISVETYIELAARSHRRLLTVDLQGLDFETSEQLTDVLAAYAYHCKNLKSITLSCLHALALDGAIEALVHHSLTELQELHVLGHDSFRAPGHQQQQQQQEGEVVPPHQQQQQPPLNEENGHQEGTQAAVAQMCHLADANVTLANLARLPLRRLTLYCPGITDFALFQFVSRSPRLVDLVLNEPTTILHHPQFHPFVQAYLPSNGEQGQQQQQVQPEVDSAPTVTPFTSAGFLPLIFARCPWLKYLFMKLTLETAQEWIVQPCFKESGLDKCLFQYRTATGTPAVVMMWDARNKVSNT
ncbi:hypothetical protein BGZ99_002292 [Dissophora globulifera]|uniref:Uncharacterized protein n=1 Tax=Dissophora globulifera TaxID=979702 RepID=A0A9P6RMW7_9FUNG|nr:hypothetical protein BGZ99_002292 [Dissophora globulifera]